MSCTMSVSTPHFSLLFPSHHLPSFIILYSPSLTLPFNSDPVHFSPKHIITRASILFYSIPPSFPCPPFTFLNSPLYFPTFYFIILPSFFISIYQTLLKRHFLSFNQFPNLNTPPFISLTPVPYPTYFSPAHLFCSSQHNTFKLAPLFLHLSPLIPSHSLPRLSHHTLEPSSTLFLFQFPNFNHLLPLSSSYSPPTLFYFHLSYHQVVV